MLGKNIRCVQAPTVNNVNFTAGKEYTIKAGRTLSVEDDKGVLNCTPFLMVSNYGDIRNRGLWGKWELVD